MLPIVPWSIILDVSQVAADKQQLKHVGSIKLFSIKLASENEWNSEQFKLEKSDLRKFYQVARQEPPSEIANSSSSSMLWTVYKTAA